MLKKDAIDLFGSPSRLAQKLGISPAAVSQWGETVPPRRKYEIRELIGQGAHLDGQTEKGDATHA